MRRPILMLALALATTTTGGCPKAEAPAGGPFSTRSTAGSVSLDLTPRLEANGHLSIAVRANTHSGDLADLDLASLMTLQVGSKTYRPTAAGRLGGHHASATVTFAVEGRPSRFSVTLAPVREMPEQRLEWP